MEACERYLEAELDNQTARREIATLPEQAGDRDGGGLRDGWKADLIRRFLDLLIASAAIALTLPLMLLVSLFVKCDSIGPVLYRQQRVGLCGRKFVLYKFRSMRHDAEADGTPIWAAERDPRVTRIGRFVRCARIDELPQLLNVLRGDMSVVGPRPERPYFVDKLSGAIPFYAHRHSVKPGITGWAQVNAPYGASIEDAREKLRYDLYYVKNRCLLLDFRILILTLRVVLFQEGAR
jgi:exopolysaccharide biosynthesis polyprenyl glycosylphosphotransferase